MTRQYAQQLYVLTPIIIFADLTILRDNNCSQQFCSCFLYFILFYFCCLCSVLIVTNVAMTGTNNLFLNLSYHVMKG